MHDMLRMMVRAMVKVIIRMKKCELLESWSSRGPRQQTNESSQRDSVCENHSGAAVGYHGRKKGTDSGFEPLSLMFVVKF